MSKKAAIPRQKFMVGQIVGVCIYTQTSVGLITRCELGRDGRLYYTLRLVKYVLRTHTWKTTEDRLYALSPSAVEHWRTYKTLQLERSHDEV